MKTEPMKTKTPQELLEQLTQEGGAILPSNALDSELIRMAQETGRFAADENGIGFVRMSDKWLEMLMPSMDGEGPDADDEGYCDHCGNLGHVNCLCGGDICACENEGEVPCPVCG